MKTIVKILDEITNIYNTDLTKVRIGNKSDGGYVALEEECIKTKQVFSFGIGDDVSFELDFVKRFPDVKIKMFDPFIDKLPEEHSNFTFYKSNIINKYDDLSKCISQNSLLKMDIEWNEWRALDLMEEDLLKRFSQILIEFHFVHVEPKENLSPYFTGMYQKVFDKVNGIMFEEYCKILGKLSKYFYIYHAHPNNSLPCITFDGYLIPSLLEVSYIRKDLVENVWRGVQDFPVKGLDFPNKTDREDIKFFGY